ncbi:MAG: hypothetical protein QOH90_914 [Actinomycetota bacterium]|jgi:hypothetical protein|nr:hypothetical protein [Actinomycetota bacterium]
MGAALLGAAAAFLKRKTQVRPGAGTAVSRAALGADGALPAPGGASTDPVIEATGEGSVHLIMADGSVVDTTGDVELDDRLRHLGTTLMGTETDPD